MAHLKYLPLALLLTACGGFGFDGSRIQVSNGCDVDMSQFAGVDGEEATKVIEKVTVDKDCNVEVIFEQELEDD